MARPIFGILFWLSSMLLFADPPWSPNVLVSTDVPWDTLNQGESCFDIWGDSIFSICNTAERGSVPIAPYAYSFNGGQSFIQIPFTDNSTGIIWHTDPVLGVDDSGYVHMIIQYSTTYIKHYLSKNGGLTWVDTTRVTPSSGVDKPWMVVNRNEIYIVWQQVSGTTGIWFAKSTDYGNTFTSSRIWTRTGIAALCMDDNENLHLALVTSWPSGNVYYRKSTDHGQTWSSEIYLSDSYYETGYGDRAPINSITARGNIVFLTWVDSRNGNWDIMGMRSTNGGITWSPRFVVNDITAGGQCKGYAHFDKYGGLHVFYYHTLDWPTSANSYFSVRHRYSSDGGATFLPSTRISDTEARSHADFIGEYHILRSDSLYIYAIWSDGRNPHDNDLYFSKALLQDFQALKEEADVKVISEGVDIPSIWSGNQALSFKSTKPLRVTLYNVCGRIVKDRRISPHEVFYPVANLPKGVYLLKIELKDKSIIKKIVRIK
ncbi:MAG: T9SS type A sorting domain-containing protein [candidate division WOR-3 bacterium]